MDGIDVRGRPGAAGLLLTVDGPVPQVLLAQRSPAVAHPLTWSVPAGVLHPGEAPVEGAIREAAEELGDLPPFRVLGTVSDAVTSAWSFHTVIARVDRAVPLTPRGVDAWELRSTRWVTERSAADMPLHPGLRRCWPRLMAVVGRRHRLAALLA